MIEAIAVLTQTLAFVALAPGLTTMIVRVTGALSRPVRGSLATRVMTFAPGTSVIRTLKSPRASAVTVGFSWSPSMVMVEFGSVLPRTR